jgi:dTDP-glucose 4,6-dehydratase
MNNKIFVTGADGFIGSHLVEALVRSGYNVKAMVLYNSMGSWGWLDTLSEDIKENIEVVLGDIRDPHCVRSMMNGCSKVIHLAALIAIPYSYIAPDSYVETNVRGTLNLLQSARDLGVDRFVHTSTSEVYGTALYVPINESHPLQSQSPYSASKTAADQLALSFYHSFELPVQIIRPFNTYGPRQSSRAVIPTIISQVASGVKNLKLGAISPTRDFTYVEDTANGFIAAIRSNNAIGEIVNLGSNFEVSISEVVELIAKQFGIDIEILEDAERFRPIKSEVNRLWSDNSKALTLLGWAPRYQGKLGFESGLKKTISLFMDKENLKLYPSLNFISNK